MFTSIVFPLKEEHYFHVFTHPSIDSKSKFELYEFIGDRIIGLIAANIIFSHYTDEGLLAKQHSCIVHKSTLASLGKILNLQNLIAFKGNICTETLLADGTEALFGGIFFSFGFEQAQNFWILNTKNLIYAPLSNKATLQEFAQKYKLMPIYTVTKISGSAHKPIFLCKVELGEYHSNGQGYSIKKAENSAAEKLLEVLKCQKVVQLQ